MKHILIPIFCSTLSFASLSNIYSFEADFTQNVTDDRNATLSYRGHIQAQKPQSALWNYTYPIQKDVYINTNSVTIVEPELEQVIIKKIESSFDFFMLIKNAMKVNENLYKASYKNVDFILRTREDFIESIQYKDEFENDVIISFKKQKQNITIDKSTFKAIYPEDFDVIGD